MGDQTVEIKQKHNLTQSQPLGTQTWRPKGDKLAFIMQWAKRFHKCQDQCWGPLEEAPAQSVCERVQGLASWGSCVQVETYQMVGCAGAGVAEECVSGRDT